MKITRIMHTSVNVAGELPETRTFYSDVLELAGAQRPEIAGVGGAWFRAGDAQVHLVDATKAGMGIDPVGPHFCLGVEDIGAAVAELDERGIEYFSATQPPDILQVWFCDPAGNTIELQQDRPLG